MVLRAVLLLALLGTASGADELVIDQRRQWKTWVIPGGVVDLRADGSLALKRFADKIDPLLNMTDFQHATRTQGDVSGGIGSLSRGNSTRFLLDGDESTWWQPRPADGVDKWVLNIDLGRLVLLQEIRLIFPDTTGARPFRDFGVFVSEGMPIWDGRDDVSFNQVMTTILPNESRDLTIKLFTRDPVSGDNQAFGDNLVIADSLTFMPVQFIRFVPREFNEDAALAEIQAVALGENIALGTIARGGDIRSSQKFQRTAPNMFDGSAERFWLANAAKAAEREWKVGGQYFEWDLGVSFWLKQIVMYAWPPTALGQTSFQASSGPVGHEIEISDGTRINLGSSSERFRGPFDYERVTLVDNQTGPRRWIMQHPFERRKTRYIFYHHFNWGRTGGWGFKVWETFLYAPGYPAEVEMVSEMISLNSIQSFEAIDWEAELPPGASVEIRTKTGDKITTNTLYYNRVGALVSEAQWNKLKSFQRGPTEEIEAEGDDWSTWSEPYKFSGEPFKSPSPRQFVRFKVILATADPEVTPVMKALTLSFESPLFERPVEAEVFPRESSVGVWDDFTLRILRPQARPSDRGFDRIFIPVPQAQVGDDISVSLRGSPLEGVTSAFSDDTLRVELPQRVLRDSLTVRFTARLLSNPTFLDVAVENSTQPGVRQRLNPAQRSGAEALTVFLPDLAGSANIIANVAVGAGTATPNGDGVNDDLLLTFDLLKVDAVPEVKFYDLRGKLVRELAGMAGSSQSYTWDATGDGGELVPPGIYLCRIEVETGLGTRSVVRTVSVVY